MVHSVSQQWRRRLVIGLAVLAVLVVLRIITRPAPNISVVRPQKRDVIELVIASGNLEATRIANIGSQVVGTVSQVLVDEGDKVQAGETVITLERAYIERQVEQAQLAVQTARAQLIKVSKPARPEDIARARAELSQARRVNTAQLRQARENLARLQRGGRPEARRQAQAVLNQAIANRKQAEINSQRAQQLFARGAIPRSDLDQAKTQLEVAKAAEESAREQLALANQPNSAEEIAVAQAQVQAAQATLQESVRIAQENLNGLLSQPHSEDVQVARDQLKEAMAALRTAQAQLALRTIVSPISGLVVRRAVEPGQSVTAGQTLLGVADMSRARVVIETDETNLPKLRVGQPAILISSAYPNNPFRGVVTQIGPEVDIQRGVTTVRIHPLAIPSYARPDMTVDANIEVASYKNTLSVPVSSLQTVSGKDYVFVVRNGRAVRQQITVLARGEEYAAIKGIPEGTPVIIRAGEVQPNEKIRPVENNR